MDNEVTNLMENNICTIVVPEKKYNGDTIECFSEKSYHDFLENHMDKLKWAEQYDLWNRIYAYKYGNDTLYLMKREKRQLKAEFIGFIYVDKKKLFKYYNNWRKITKYRIFVAKYIMEEEFKKWKTLMKNNY